MVDEVKPPLCIDCRHCSQKIGYRCRAPKPDDLVTGQYDVACEDARLFGQFCGPQGLAFDGFGVFRRKGRGNG